MLKKRVRTVLDRMGLARVYFRFLEWRIAQRDKTPPPKIVDGAPVPPAYLITLIAGTPDWQWFLKSGKATIGVLADYAAEAGCAFPQAKRILDLGCGCGRLVRHLSGMTDAEVYGVDYNPRLVDWCARNLKGKFSRNRLQPPLPFPDAYFDVVYLMSVFTHLRLDTQREWLNELHRITRPGGVVLVTFHDEDYVTLPAKEEARASLAATGVYIFNDHVQGSNFMATYQTREITRDMFSRHFEVVRIAPSGDPAIGQATVIARRPAS
jgi:SAM-dependent methyltransferase